MIRNVSAFLLAVLCLVAQTRAQDLSLSDAIQKGLSQNFNILVEQATIEIARTNNNWAQAGRYPTINFILNQNNTLNNVIAPAPFQLKGKIINNGVVPGVAAEWVLFDGFAIRLTRERLSQLQQQAEGNARIVIENTVQDIILAYYNALVDRERLKILERAVQLSRDRYEYMVFKKEIGSAITSDVLLEKSNYLTDSTGLINQQLDFRNSMRTLNMLMAEPEINKMYNLTEKLEFPDSQYNLEDLAAKMTAENSNLRAQYINQELLKTDYLLRRSELMPRIALNAGSTYTLNKQNLDNAQRQDGSGRYVSARASTGVVQSNNNFANFTLSMPIFNGGQIRRAIENTQTQQKIVALRLEGLKQQLNRDLASAYDLYNVRRTLASISHENTLTAETNLKLAEEKFKQGKINSFEYRILQNNYMNAAYNELQATFNLIDANTTLLRLTGGIINEK